MAFFLSFFLSFGRSPHIFQLQASSFSESAARWKTSSGTLVITAQTLLSRASPAPPASELSLSISILICQSQSLCGRPLSQRKPDSGLALKRSCAGTCCECAVLVTSPGPFKFKFCLFKLALSLCGQATVSFCSSFFPLARYSLERGLRERYF